MALMKTDMALRDGPGGATIHIIANMRARVEVVGSSDIWSKIKVLDFVNEPEGWVQTAAIDLQGVTPDTPVEKDVFAKDCWLEALLSGINPHYLVAAADLRQTMFGNPDATNIGPFRLTTAEWTAVRADAGFKLQSFTASDIWDWRRQCTALALMTQRAFETLNGELAKITANRKCTPAELYLAQMIGPVATAEAAKNPDKSIKAVLDGVPATALPLGGLAPDKLIERHAKFLQIAGPPVTSATGQDALQRVTAELQKSLDKVKDAVVAAGTQVLGDQPDDLMISLAQEQLEAGTAPGNLPNVPTGTKLKIDGAGGPLGELIARGEGDYNTFNRGNAGDNPHARIDFSKMTLGEIMTLQALPKGNSNRLFAVGKYQIIPLTMQGTVAKLGIQGNEKFTPQLQERCFRQYLVADKRPKVKAFITGASSDLRTAQFELAFEFASVARPDTHRSNYGGLAGNKASISADETKGALEAERDRYAALRNEGKTADQAWQALSPGALV
jgi:hypothetical protein